MSYQAIVPPCRPELIKNSTCFFWSSQSSSCEASLRNHVNDGAWTPEGKDLVDVEPMMLSVCNLLEEGLMFE